MVLITRTKTFVLSMPIVCLPPRYIMKWLRYIEVCEFHADIFQRPQHSYLRSLKPTEAVPGGVTFARDVIR